MYQPLPNYLTVAKSKIQGLGLFAIKAIDKETELGISHVKEKWAENNVIRTPLGGFVNHSENPNCETYEWGRFYKMKTIKDISKGEELTLKYKWYKVTKCDYQTT